MLLQPGRMVGAYEIVESLGRGGMGEVYRARDTHLPRFVAIKVVSARLDKDPTATERLKREAMLASSLNHPAIVTIHDVGDIEGAPYIVMEFIDGRPLSDELASGALDVREAVDLAAQVADGLAAAHAAGVVHRDLKPQNVMVTRDRRAKIVDFGLSKVAPLTTGSDDETLPRPVDLTQPHTVLGTAGYMAPEQVAGHDAISQTDQFSLGVLLYEMLSGRRAFKRDSVIQTLAAIERDQPTPLTTLRSGLPPALLAIVDRCLAKRPQDRFGSTRDLAHDLAAVRDHPQSGSLSALSPPHPTRYWRAAAAGALVLVMAGTVYAFYARAHRPRPRSAAFRQVAVLPFVCADPNDQVLCDGIQETLTIDLTRLSSFDPSLRVVSQQIQRRDLPPGKTDDPAMAQSALGATLTIQGNVERRGSETVVTLRRTEGARSQSRTVAIAEGRQAAMPRDLVSAAAALLDVKLSRSIWQTLRAWLEGGAFVVSAPIDKDSTAAPEAYLAYLRGRGYLHAGRPSADQAIEALTRAIRSDSRYALAHAALCEAYWQKLQAEPARAACLAALQIDSELVPVHLALIRNAGQKERGEAIARAENLVKLARFSSDARTELGLAYLKNNNLPSAEAAYLDGLQDLPDDAQILGELCRLYLTWASSLGKPENKPKLDQARTACQQAVTRTPDSTRVLNSLGSTLFLSELYEDAAARYLHSMAIRPTSTAAANLGLYSYRRENYAEAASRYQQALALGPDDPMPNRIKAWQGLGAASWAARADPGTWQNAYRQVIELIRRYLAQNQLSLASLDLGMVGQLADAHSMLNQRADARAALEALERRNVKDNELMFVVASAHAQIGDLGHAIDWLARAVAAGYPCDQVTRSPFLKELRKDPKFADVGCRQP